MADDPETSSLSRAALAHFGREIIKSARDWTIREMDALVDGTSASPMSAPIREEIAKAGPEAQALVKKLIPKIVDTTLHYVMWMFEHPTHHGIRLSVTLPDGETCPDLSAISDGLAGDLIAWIEAFAEQRSKTFLEGKAELPADLDVGD